MTIPEPNNETIPEIPCQRAGAPNVQDVLRNAHYYNIDQAERLVRIAVFVEWCRNGCRGPDEDKNWSLSVELQCVYGLVQVYDVMKKEIDSLKDELALSRRAHEGSIRDLSAGLQACKEFRKRAEDRLAALGETK